MNRFRLFLVSVLLSACAHAHVEGLVDGHSLFATSVPLALAAVVPGSIVIVGENHGLKTHQNQQIQIMTELRQRGLPVSVGLEFFTFTDQPLVNQYRDGTLSEADFLSAIRWGSPSFEFYRDQALFPLAADGSMTVALNAPRSLTGKVAKSGLASLNAGEKALLPPGFELGRDSYRRRFVALMPHLPDAAAADRYFAAQSIWDDTMAWQATQFLDQNPQQVLVIVVGEFHVQYGGGLPDRIRARRPQTSILTISQINSKDLTPEELDQELRPTPADGDRAHYLWVAPAL